MFNCVKLVYLDGGFSIVLGIFPSIERAEYVRDILKQQIEWQGVSFKIDWAFIENVGF